ncbi:nuclear transport factor 2 family protein [Paramicrobacterium fandaimingii]|uniref:nuclear transport factor 2 family protein n=1 Tax=Paramicrobacterium fandaimingii TaxID=2708079 RepID=UPI001F48788A|nr:nuclear transport factor 2 family protein [Microbacterium fandaimingii]
MMDHGREDNILALEHRGWQSLCDGTGDAFYGSIMTDDGVMVLAGGFALDRAGVVASLADAPRWDRFAITDERVIAVRDEVRTLVYTGTAARGSEPEFRALMCSTYVRLNGEWRLALYQQTRSESD